MTRKDYKDERGNVVSITRGGQPVDENKYGERVSPFVRKARAGGLPAKALSIEVTL